MLYYYKTEDESSWVCLQSPLPQKNKNYIEITKEEWDAHKASLEPTQAEIEAREINFQIAQLKAELAETDYVALKLSEAIAEGTQDEILNEYADVFARRKELRAQINSLQEQLNNN